MSDILQKLHGTAWSGVNLTAAFEVVQDAVVEQLNNDKMFGELGYVPAELDGSSASLTLAFALDNAAAAQLGALSGVAPAETAQFRNLSQAYRNVWTETGPPHTTGGYLCPRLKNGSFACPLLAAAPYFLRPWAAGYTEGDADQWRWFVQHDVPGLIPGNGALCYSSRNWGRYARMDGAHGHQFR